MTTPNDIKCGGENKVTSKIVRTGLRIPSDSNTELVLLADEQGVSKDALMLQILWNYVEKKKDKIKILRRDDFFGE